MPTSEEPESLSSTVFIGSRFTSSFSVRPDDLDLFQHVHSSRYQDYLLAARFDQMERCYGISMKAFIETRTLCLTQQTFPENIPRDPCAT